MDGSLLEDVGSLGAPSSFGEDALGNLYIVDYAGGTSGEVFRIATNALLAGDYNADGEVDETDYTVWKASFGSTSALAADGNGNGVVDAADYTVWRNHLGTSVHTGSGVGTVSPVPEPASAAIFAQLLGLLTLATRRRGA